MASTLSRQSVLLQFLLLLGCSTSLVAQSKLKLAVYGLDDRTAATQGMNVGSKVSDALVSKLVASGKYDVVDRNYLTQLLREQNLGVDGRFDPVAAAKIGKLANVQAIIVGQIDAFNANITKNTSHGFASNKEVDTGVVMLKVTVRLLDVSTGSVMTAPSAEAQTNAVLEERTSSNLLNGLSHTKGDANVNAALARLVDSSIDNVSETLATDITKVPLSEIGGGVSAKVIGMNEGQVLINRGSAAGLKSGDLFDVFHETNTGLKDPDTGAPVLRRQRICTVALVDVEPNLAAGKCDGQGVPSAGDLALPAKSPAQTGH